MARNVTAYISITAAIIFLGLATSDGYSFWRTSALIVVSISLFAISFTLWMSPKQETE